MAFPSLNNTDVGQSEETAGVLTHDVIVPTNIVSGDKLVLLIAMGAAATVSDMPAGWTQRKTLPNGTACQLEVWEKTADGAETNFTYTTSAGVESANRCYRISGHHASTDLAISTGATGTDNAADPDSLDPADWATEDTLWLAFAVIEVSTVSTYPTSYDDNQFTVNTGGAAGVTLGIASRENATGSEDPATFGLSGSNEWCAVTIAIRPAGAGAADPEGSLIGGKLLRGGLLTHGVLVR